MSPDLDLFKYEVDNDTLPEMRVGQIGTVKGKLEGVRFGNTLGREPGRQTTKTGRIISAPGDPSLVITFANWDQLAITIRDYATARGIRIPLQTYVGVKVQKIHEDGDLLALAIWELGGGGVQPLGEPMRQVTRHTHTHKTTVSEPSP